MTGSRSGSWAAAAEAAGGTGRTEAAETAALAVGETAWAAVGATGLTASRVGATDGKVAAVPCGTSSEASSAGGTDGTAVRGSAGSCEDVGMLGRESIGTASVAEGPAGRTALGCGVGLTASDRGAYNGGVGTGRTASEGSMKDRVGCSGCRVGPVAPCCETGYTAKWAPEGSAADCGASTTSEGAVTGAGSSGCAAGPGRACCGTGSTANCGTLGSSPACAKGSTAPSGGVTVAAPIVGCCEGPSSDGSAWTAFGAPAASGVAGPASGRSAEGCCEGPAAKGAVGSRTASLALAIGTTAPGATGGDSAETLETSGLGRSAGVGCGVGPSLAESCGTVS